MSKIIKRTYNEGVVDYAPSNSLEDLFTENLKRNDPDFRYINAVGKDGVLIRPKITDELFYRIKSTHDKLIEIEYIPASEIDDPIFAPLCYVNAETKKRLEPDGWYHMRAETFDYSDIIVITNDNFDDDSPDANNKSATAYMDKDGSILMEFNYGQFGWGPSFIYDKKKGKRVPNIDAITCYDNQNIIGYKFFNRKLKRWIGPDMIFTDAETYEPKHHLLKVKSPDEKWNIMRYDGTFLLDKWVDNINLTDDEITKLDRH